MNPVRKFWEICCVLKPIPMPAPPRRVATAVVEIPKVTISPAATATIAAMVNNLSSKLMSIASSFGSSSSSQFSNVRERKNAWPKRSTVQPTEIMINVVDKRSLESEGRLKRCSRSCVIQPR